MTIKYGNVVKLQLFCCCWLKFNVITPFCSESCEVEWNLKLFCRNGLTSSAELNIQKFVIFDGFGSLNQIKLGAGSKSWFQFEQKEIHLHHILYLGQELLGQVSHVRATESGLIVLILILAATTWRKEAVRLDNNKKKKERFRERGRGLSF